MSILAPVPKPESRLARYRVLSPYASVHVSPFQLGGMSIGDKWEQFGMGGMNKESSLSCWMHSTKLVEILSIPPTASKGLTLTALLDYTHPDLAKIRVRKSSLVNGPSNVVSEISSLSRSR